MNEVVRSTQLEDANIVAYLSMKGFIAIPYIMEGSARVAWDVQGDIDQEIQEYYHDKTIRDFVKSLKEVRSAIFTVKSIHNQEKEGDK